MADATGLCVSAGGHDAPLALPGRGVRPSGHEKKARRASSAPVIASFREDLPQPLANQRQGIAEPAFMQATLTPKSLYLRICR